MGNYAMWRTAADKGDLRRVTFVCGDQHVLIEEVVDELRHAVKPSGIDYITLSAAANRPVDVWNTVNQYGLGYGSRLVVVRDAEHIKRWDPFLEWLNAARSMPQMWILFVSNDIDPPPIVKTVAAKRRLTHVVRCTMPNESDAVAWIQRRGPGFDPRLARYLLTRTGGSLALAATVVDKCNLFDGAPNTDVIDRLCAEVPGESFVDYLIARRKPQAIAAAHGMSDRDMLAAIAQLDNRIELMHTLWLAARTGKPLRDISGHPPWLLRKYVEHAKHYAPDRCAYSRRLLAVVDSAVRNGVRTGAMEALVALW